LPHTAGRAVGLVLVAISVAIAALADRDQCSDRVAAAALPLIGAMPSSAL
jgi:hypothetical protein